MMNLSSPELTELYRQCVDRCLPFWYEHGVDHERGGFFGDVKDDGSLGSDAKGGWYQGFGVWLFAYYYNWRCEERYLQAARHGWHFMRDHGRDTDGNWVMNLSRDGEILEGATSVLTDAYLAHGLVELHRADPGEGCLEAAREMLLRVREQILRPDFCLSAPSYTEPHSLNGAWSTLLYPVSDLLRECPGDTEMSAMADLCVDAIFQKHLEPEMGLIVEAVAPNGEPYTGRQRNLVKPGAAAESCTAVMIEADRRNDPDLRRRAVEILSAHFEAAWDRDSGGGVFYEIDLEGNPVEDRKAAWAQAEFMRGFITAMATESDEWIVEAYERVHNWAFEIYADGPDDLWRLAVTRDLRPDLGRKLDMVHHPRMLLSILQILEARMPG